MRYAIVIEGAGSNYCAYAPDLPGCIATAPTVDEAKRTMLVAMRMHLERLRAASLPVPVPLTTVADLDIDDM